MVTLKQFNLAVFLPLPESVFAYGLALTVAVAAEEGARYGIWLGHRWTHKLMLVFCHPNQNVGPQEDST